MPVADRHDHERDDQQEVPRKHEHVGEVEGDAVRVVTEQERVRNAVAVEATRRAIDLVLDQLDLTQLVLDHVDIERIVASVDLNEVVEQLDVDAVADRLDIERVIARLDLAKLSLEVIERIDLPEIIRTSTGTVASESVRVVRMQTFGADRAISGLVGRMLGRSTTEEAADPDDLDATGE